MLDQYFGWELSTILKQFVAAFDSTIISRYDKNNVARDNIKVNYTYAPKDRVLHDHVNKSSHIKLPVVAVTSTGMRLDRSRLQQKLDPYNFTKTPSISGGYLDSNTLPAPTPVNISIQMSILTESQVDMDQILGNIMQNTDPYIYISWKIPVSQGLLNGQELRSKITWDENIQLSYPNLKSK